MSMPRARMRHLPEPRRLGAYWLTPVLAPAIVLESAVARFVRGLVEQKIIALDEVSGLLARGIEPHPVTLEPAPDSQDAIGDFRAFLREQGNAFGEHHIPEILIRVRNIARRGRELWDERSYWPDASTERAITDKCRNYDTREERGREARGRIVCCMLGEYYAEQSSTKRVPSIARSTTQHAAPHPAAAARAA